uniref:Transposase Tnp1/En/Spm-like domain-containing protein n=1 Tax=Ananas comosus var. bracteatus TaxID=296719 RepID=A0A6V7NXE2_ANACO|nr:unnamed protein product [Ananas comosus var. bracteatus]
MMNDTGEPDVQDIATMNEKLSDEKTGEFVDSDTERKVNAARKELTENTQGSEPSKKVIEEIFTKHIGAEHNGRVKGLGLGPTPTSYYRLNCWDLPLKNQTSSSKEQSTEVDKLKGEMKDMREEVDRLRALISQKFPEENIGSPSLAPVPPINPQVVDHGSANDPFPNIRSSFSSHEPSNADLHGRTI